MTPSPSINDRLAPIAFSLALGRQRPRSHRRHSGFGPQSTPPIVVAQRADRSFTADRSHSLGSKPIAATAAIQTHQASRRGQIPIAPAAPPLHHPRDFVPWRFSDAGRSARG